MSALDRPKIEDAERVILDAETALREVCHGKRRFEMCVPVQETDTDIVIGNALYIGRQLLAELSRVTAERDAYLKALLEIECETVKRTDKPLAGLLNCRRIANGVLPPEVAE